MRLYLCQRTLYTIWFLYISVYVLTKMLGIVKLLCSLQVLLAVIQQPVRLSCSRFTTTTDIILSSSLSIKIINTQCITAPTTDPVLVLGMTSSYRTTLLATQDRILIVAIPTPFPQDIQLGTVGFSLEADISLLLTLKCFTS